MNKIVNLYPNATIQDVFDSMNDNTKDCLYYLVGIAIESKFKNADNLCRAHKKDIIKDGTISIRDVLYSMTPNELKVTKFIINKAIEDM